MFSATKVFSPDKGYSCVFRNFRAKSHCRHLHGYDLRFEFHFYAQDEDLTEEGWVIDFGGFAKVKEFLDLHFDHKLLVAADDPQLDVIGQLAGLDAANVVVLVNVSCEAFAQFVFYSVRAILREAGAKCRLGAVTVHENGSNSARYFEGIKDKDK